MRGRELLVGFVLLLTVHCGACSASQNHVVAQDALTASQILCVLASSLTDDAAVAQACAVDKALVPQVRPFLAVKESRRGLRPCGDIRSNDGALQ